MAVKDFQWVAGIESPALAKTEMTKFVGLVREYSKLELDRLTAERQKKLVEDKLKELPLVSKFKVRLAHGKRMKFCIKTIVDETFKSESGEFHL